MVSMKQYLLDTNICVFLLRGQYDIDKKLDKVGLARCYISEITEAELKYGAEKARLRVAGTPADDDFDLLIGCTAVVNDMVMVTENMKHFKNLTGIQLENWIER